MISCWLSSTHCTSQAFKFKCYPKNRITNWHCIPYFTPYWYQLNQEDSIVLYQMFFEFLQYQHQWARHKHLWQWGHELDLPHMELVVWHCMSAACNVQSQFSAELRRKIHFFYYSCCLILSLLSLHTTLYSIIAVKAYNKEESWLLTGSVFYYVCFWKQNMFK